MGAIPANPMALLQSNSARGTRAWAALARSEARAHRRLAETTPERLERPEPYRQRHPATRRGRHPSALRPVLARAVQLYGANAGDIYVSSNPSGPYVWTHRTCHIGMRILGSWIPQAGQPGAVQLGVPTCSSAASLLRVGVGWGLYAYWEHMGACAQPTMRQPTMWAAIRQPPTTSNSGQSLCLSQSEARSQPPAMCHVGRAPPLAAPLAVGARRPRGADTVRCGLSRRPEDWMPTSSSTDREDDGYVTPLFAVADARRSGETRDAADRRRALLGRSCPRCIRQCVESDSIPSVCAARHAPAAGRRRCRRLESPHSDP